MGKRKLGPFIRQINYLGAKKDYKDSADDPCDQLQEVKMKEDELSLDDFKDAFAAFEEKICIKGFPENGTPASDVAISTIGVLTSKASDMDDGDAQMATKMAAIMFHALVALVKAGPCSTHLKLMEQIRRHSSPDVTGYAQTLDRQSLIPAITAGKEVLFKALINLSDDTDNFYTSYYRGELDLYFRMFSKEQVQLVQREFLDTYIHYHRQMPNIPEKYGEQVYDIVSKMPEKFENGNPYWNLKDAKIIKEHVAVIKGMLLAKGYHSWSPTDNAAEETLEKIMKAVINDGYIEDVFDHLMSALIELHKNETFRRQGKRIYYVFRSALFKNLGEKQNVQKVKLYKSCVDMVSTFLTQGKLDKESEGVLECAIEFVITSVKTVSPEDVTLTLTIVNGMLESGRPVLIKKAESVLKHLKQTKVLDWKKHLDEAKQLIASVAKIKVEDMFCEKGNICGRPIPSYCSFMKTFMEQFKKNKVLPELQSSFVDFIFDCIVISAPEKAELAEEMARRDFIDLSKEGKLRLVVLQKGEDVLKMDLPWDDMTRAISNVLARVVGSYDGNGKKVTDEENKLFMSIFKMVSQGGDSVVEHFYHEDRPNHRMYVWQDVLKKYVETHKNTATMSLLLPIMPEVLRWARISYEDDHDDMMRLCYDILDTVVSCTTTSVEFKTCLPEFVDLMLESEKYGELWSMVKSLYPHNPSALHDRLDDIFEKMDDLKDMDRSIVTTLLHTVALKHPEVFQKQHITKLFELYEGVTPALEPLILLIIKSIGEKYPKNLVDFLPTLCDDKIFKPDSLNLRSGIISYVGGVNKKLGETAVDYMMKYVDSTDPTISFVVTVTLSAMVKAHMEYMQKHKPKLEKLEKTTTNSKVKDLAHDMILILEGKSVENIVEDIEQQREDIADLDIKVDATMGTVITIGDKVIEHDKEIGDLEIGLERVEERVDDVEEEQEETKIKIEEIDNKTMSNAPKWSRDLTKLMNPEADSDWRLLASRLGYSNDDIRGWATQHDPCMALLSEWYATHKTSEASYGVLTALVEMNRMDGAAIVENAMKLAEGVVEDEEFEYPSPPPVFISYQWGFQNEVKLLKKHLNMAGYECWMDVGQMGGGDKLFAKIDNGIRAAKIVICCVTEKYAQSPNCNREVNLSVNLNKPIIPLLMEKMDWPPKGSMGPIFSEYLFIRFFQREGEETPDNDQRYWPISKFQELLMQLNFFVVPDQKIVQKEYARWWDPIIEEVVIDKNRSKKKESLQTLNQNKSQIEKSDESPLVFLSYQWGKQPQVKALYQRLTSLGYSVWMDIYQMGGGDSLYDKIDKGMRGCNAVISCVTQKYSLSANCRREISLADALKKPIIPLLLEQIKWPPDGPMSMVFTELLYINFYRDEAVQMTWIGDQFDELLIKLGHFVSAKVKTAGDRANVSKVDSREKVQNKTKAVGVKQKDADRPKEKDKNKMDEKSKEAVIDKKTPKKTGETNRSITEKETDKGQKKKNTATRNADNDMKESAMEKQTAEKEKNSRNSRRTSLSSESSVKKAAIGKGFGGSIVKDKIALDIAAGKRSTLSNNAANKSGKVKKDSEGTDSLSSAASELPRHRTSDGSIFTERKETETKVKPKAADRISSNSAVKSTPKINKANDLKPDNIHTNKTPGKSASLADSKVQNKVASVSTVSKGRFAKSQNVANETESDRTKSKAPPNTQNLRDKQEVDEERSLSKSQSINENGNKAGNPKLKDKASAKTKRTENDLKEVNGDAGTKKSKSCIIL